MLLLLLLLLLLLKNLLVSRSALRGKFGAGLTTRQRFDRQYNILSLFLSLSLSLSLYLSFFTWNTDTVM